MYKRHVPEMVVHVPDSFMCIFVILMNYVFLFSAFTAFSFPLTLMTSLIFFFGGCGATVGGVGGERGWQLRCMENKIAKPRFERCC